MSDTSDPTSVTPEAADREVMGLILGADAELLTGLLRGTGESGGDTVLSALAASRNLALTVDDIQRALVRQAREQGRTWAAVGQVLHVSRQAAFQRFGGDADGGDSDDDPAATSLQGAREGAARLLRLFVGGDFEEMRSGFDARMRNACPVALLEKAREKVEREVGAFRETGSASATTRSGYAVVDLPMAFERGTRVGRIAFNADAEVSGFFMLPGEGADGA